MKLRSAKKQKSSDHGIRANTDKWVPEYMNDECEELKDEFVEWYHWWLGIRENAEVATDGFHNFLQGYFDEVFVKNIVNASSEA